MGSSNAIITLLLVITVERQWVIAVQYRLVLRLNGLFPGGTKEHTKKIEVEY